MPTIEKLLSNDQSVKYEIELLDNSHDKREFKCEEESLNSFLFFSAKQHAKKDISKTYVLVPYGEKRVLGYYTLVNSSLQLQDLPDQKGFPREYAVTAVKLARLARDVSMKGFDVGEVLLMSALTNAVAVADLSGAAVLELDAMNESVRDKFYMKFGFKQLLDDRLHLYLPMPQVRKLMAGR